MPSFRFSRLAEADLLSIAAYTLRTWGEAQTVGYTDGLEACCQGLPDNPATGRSCDNARPGLRRIEYGGHVVFYRVEKLGILISRILHERMIPEKLASGEDDGEM